MTSMLYLGDCLSVMRTLPDASVDAVVTDPPYGLKFMGKRWDCEVPSVDVWAECLRLLKPGGHLLAFAGTRTQHRMAVRIEDAGFEIRDIIAWVYGSGFPKSADISKSIDKAAGAEREVVGDKLDRPGYHLHGHHGGEAFGHGIARTTTETRLKAAQITAPATPEARQWSGWGTALKPALEPITVARKPLSEGTVAGNVLKHGTGALNVDGCRVGTEVVGWGGARGGSDDSSQSKGRNYRLGEGEAKPVVGRWPANLIHDGSDEVTGLFPESKSCNSPSSAKPVSKFRPVQGNYQPQGPIYPGDSGSAARFFYAAKASRSEREGSTHPTVKPLALMRYLCRLVTPPEGIVLDPFMGSGSTGKAAQLEGFSFIGIERDPVYHATATMRINGESAEGDTIEPSTPRLKPINGHAVQMSLFAGALD